MRKSLSAINRLVVILLLACAMPVSTFAQGATVSKTSIKKKTTSKKHHKKKKKKKVRVFTHHSDDDKKLKEIKDAKNKEKTKK